MWPEMSPERRLELRDKDLSLTGGLAGENLDRHASRTCSADARQKPRPRDRGARYSHGSSPHLLDRARRSHVIVNGLDAAIQLSQQRTHRTYITFVSPCWHLFSLEASGFSDIYP